MAVSPSIRRTANLVLPRSIVERLSGVEARRQRRKDERKLPTATSAFDASYAEYWRTGVVPADAPEKLFLATWASNGTAPVERARVQGAPFDPSRYDEFPDELLGDLDPAAVADAVERDGCYVAPTRLPDAAVADILRVLEAGPAEPRGDGLGQRKPSAPDASAPTWWMDPASALRSESVRRLLQERRLAQAAGRYLSVDPMIMSVALWKSYAWKSADKQSAQHFHFDNDRAAFVKMFVYLTDVEMENGPHVYVLGSHRTKPSDLLHGQRLSDESVERHFPRDRWRVITGPRGTVVFADTAGFHKGGHVRRGERGMFQINVASDRFGVDEPTVGPAIEAPTDLRDLVLASPRYFTQLFTPEVLVP